MNFPRLLFSSVLFLTSVILTACSTPNAAPALPEKTDAHTLILAGEEEPGQRLTIFGSVVNAQTGQPIPGAQVYLYHADANAEYTPSDPADESTARLSGEVTTGVEGQFTVYTIVPREYDVPGNRHIHLHYVRAAGYQDGGGVILFEYDVNNDIRQWANDTGFGTIIDLEDIDGSQQGSITILLEPVD